MPYIDKDFYDSEYEGMPVHDVENFNRLAKRASGVVDFITNHALISLDFDKLDPFIQGQVKKATAAQIEYLLVSGQGASLGAGGFGQVRAGNFSYGDRQGDAAENRTQKMTSAAVLSHLSPTGLLYQGVAVCD